ncbi:halocyanin (plasmid) [Halolamina sp. CBA1230]|uniref:plastocyanin/azurin family copper-binding protein n=1 Tax=Halolamina sp. CBA1230 TaxID=1853690 RepID=UPI0009A20F7C|nr:plastocyanin/azurin family copper-binding protein [Halolamina sp. CBA1230]QKY22082.1 halocyanin [Halolamina sp. CBA1230]
MERRKVLKTAGFAATAGLTGLAGCSSPSSETESPSNDGTETPSDEGTDSSANGGTTTTVEMHTENGEYYFDPIGLFVESGTTVTFENASGSHSATAYDESIDSASTTRIPEGASVFDSGILSEEGATFEHTFETTGTYDYFCTPHKSLGMVGRIVVGEPGGPAEGSMPPDGDVPESGTIVDQGSVAFNDFSD